MKIGCNINRTGASPGTFFTVSGTAQKVPAEDLSILIGSQLEWDVLPSLTSLSVNVPLIPCSIFLHKFDREGLARVQILLSRTLGQGL